MSSKSRPAPAPPVFPHPVQRLGSPDTPPPLPGTLGRGPGGPSSQSTINSRTDSSRSYPSDDNFSTIYRRRKEDPTSLPYFYSNFSNQNEVADYLKFHSKGRPGYFLVRPSFRNPKNLTVSVVTDDKSVRHCNIVKEVNGGQAVYFLVKEKKFESVVDLINFYQRNEVRNLQNVKNVRFQYPIESRSSRHNDNGSASSGSSLDRPYNSPGSSAGMVEPPQEQRPPPLPIRPTDLGKPNPQRNSSIDSFNNVFSQSPSGSGPSVAASFDYPENFGASWLPHEAAGSQMSLNSVSTGMHSFPSTSSVNVDARPPAPLPQGHKTSDKNLYYSTPRDVDQDISNRLKEVLKQSERCDCGIPRDMSELPMGWTVHRSKDKGTYGRIFYQSSKGVTSWKLPEDVQRKLNATHRMNLNKLMYMQKQPQMNINSYLDNSGEDHHRGRISGPNSGSGGNADPRLISGSSSGSGGQTSGTTVRIKNITQL